ncbi:YaeQ family protein [Halotalea alkalilenta]|uniref:YaeQ family protein n=1 Tax=Halotalea alkalilenta TaxID=376489 RepID=A0A172YAG4_9GAMM|nr:YaeQ family protein [Halotalea alkalilenta]ANF56241.1 hypothetical protein A5892_01150 [Halotalea alkalilenta]
MALTATPYKFNLQLSDLDRGLYPSVRLTVARHPSETPVRLAARLLAYALWYDERLEFGRGLSNVDEPALWEKSLDGRVLHWIEVGQPDAERLDRAARRDQRVSLLAYGNLAPWEEKHLPSLARLDRLRIAAPDQQALETLAAGLQRSIEWSVMVSEGALYVTDAEGQHDMGLRWVK